MGNDRHDAIFGPGYNQEHDETFDPAEGIRLEEVSMQVADDMMLAERQRELDEQDEEDAAAKRASAGSSPDAI